MTRDGFTMIELLFVVAIIGTIMLFAFKMHAPILTFFRHSQAQQQMTVDVRQSVDFMMNAIQAGKASSAVISTAPGSAVPNSRINFALVAPLTSGTSAYTFTLLADRTIQMSEYRPGLLAPASHSLASNVSALMFAGDSSIPGVIYLTLRIDPPAEVSGSLPHPFEILNQEIHMVTNP